MDQQRLLNIAYTTPGTGDIQPLLSALCDATRQQRATYGEYHATDTLPQSFMSIGVDEDESKEFLSSHHRHNVWRHHRNESHQLNTNLFLASRDVSEEDRRDTAWYQSFMPRHHMADAISICSQRDRTSHVALTVISETGQGTFEADTLAALNGIYPQLSQALSLFRRMRGITLQRQFYETTSCSKQQAHVLLDNFGRIVECTDNALDILREGDGIHTEEGYLRLHDSALDQRYKSSFKQTLEALNGRAMPTPIAVERPSGDMPYVVDFCPWVLHESSAADKQVHVLITLFTPDKKPDLRDELVQAAYGLSCAETRVVRALVNGMDLKEIAEANHITVYTVRNHLKSVFAKTGFKRQGELIGKLVNFIAE
ncbi:MAG: helix-turn-helix transcriptional regulator [Pseudomonadota bacterium]